MSDASRYKIIDAFRGLAALWVVMAHACTPYVLTNANLIANPVYAISMKGQLGVAIFFIISGYCIIGSAVSTMKSGKSPFIFIKNRFLRIYPPYIFSIILSLISGFLLILLQTKHVLPLLNHTWVVQSHWSELKFWISNLSITQLEFKEPSILIVYWSLCYEIVFYIIVFFIILYTQNQINKQYESLGFAIISVSISFLTYLSLLWMILAPFSCPFPLDRWYQFGLGALFYLCLNTRGHSCSTSLTGFSNPKLHLLICISLTLIFAFCKPLTFNNGLWSYVTIFHEPSSRLQAITSLIFLLCLFITNIKPSYFSFSILIKPFVLLGIVSYSLYLTHTIILPYVDVAFRKSGLIGNLYIVNFIMQVVTAVIISVFFYYAFERNYLSHKASQRILIETSSKDSSKTSR
jgi:peptidoglycan/LPS O-acetylase OafA/YrhL